MTTAVPQAVRPPAAPGLVAAALLVVYVVWGSTYLFIRIVVEEAPPLLGMGTRYLLAGLLLGGVLVVRGGRRRLRVSRRELLGCTFLGLMLPVLGNGMVSIGEDLGAESGITALLIAIAPLMITVFRYLDGDRPRPLSVVGVLLGLAGLGYLVLAGSGEGHVPLGAAFIVLFASTCWAFGSWSQPKLPLPRDVFVMIAYEMVSGGMIMMVLGAGRGERLDLASYSFTTYAAWAYLVVFGSMVAFTAYVWLLSNAPIGLVATYAYVNPVVAVALGALVLGERLTPAVLIGGGVIVVAVAIVITVERPRRPDQTS
jgi:drug/metabolite transporter (DMT)-like permease